MLQILQHYFLSLAGRQVNDSIFAQQTVSGTQRLLNMIRIFLSRIHPVQTLWNTPSVWNGNFKYICLNSNFPEAFKAGLLFKKNRDQFQLHISLYFHVLLYYQLVHHLALSQKPVSAATTTTTAVHQKTKPNLNPWIMNTSGLPTLHEKLQKKIVLLGSSNLQHKYCMGRKLRKKKLEHSTDVAVLLKLSNLRFYTHAPTLIH